MKNTIILLILFQSIICSAQVANREIRKGNKEYDKKAYNEAEIHYRKALEKKPGSETATYNLANALYKQDQFEPSITKYESIARGKGNAAELSKYYYNLGNAYFKTQKMEKAIEAYKQSLRMNSKDMDAKHNLFLAENMQKQQQKQQNQQNKDQKDQNDKDKKDQQKNQEQQKDQQQKQNQDNQQEKQGQQQTGKEQQISKEDAERLLEALEQDEKNVLKKLEDQKMQVRKIPVEKEW